jgi:hypothetical protein
VESLPEKILAGVAIAYIAFMVLLPFANVFYQVRLLQQLEDQTTKQAVGFACAMVYDM